MRRVSEIRKLEVDEFYCVDVACEMWCGAWNGCGGIPSLTPEQLQIARAQIELDGLKYGISIVGPNGERIDPQTVYALPSDWPERAGLERGVIEGVRFIR